MPVLLREASMKTPFLLFTELPNFIVSVLNLCSALLSLLLTAGSIPSHLELTHHTCTHTHPCHSFSQKRILILIWHWKTQCLIYSTSAYQDIQNWTVDKRSGMASTFLVNVNQQSSRPKLVVLSMWFQVAIEVLVWEGLMLWPCTPLCLCLFCVCQDHCG